MIATAHMQSAFTAGLVGATATLGAASTLATSIAMGAAGATAAFVNLGSAAQSSNSTVYYIQPGAAGMVNIPATFIIGLAGFTGCLLL
ncbi:uncharacterized protein BCR38DRAFT_429860 [Pseudomassariella vexata]|uniref:Uncharacterized protein n=1 Tax=Pseudomassariella vexata TaxID=1141098 RepID=A0A1Y2E426_9PEZI|nr:uncharacterized protein BCR38DRAFT_429860 [Pseudomassariella vexata]ORY66310.1 hypothetical protein BCR38DRAFT_429860 [Pseudomassariella vexata]